MKTLPIIKILTLSLEGNDLITQIQVKENDLPYFSEPVAPASIINKSGKEFILHKLLNSNHTVLSFITYDFSGEYPPLEDKYDFS